MGIENSILKTRNKGKFLRKDNKNRISEILNNKNMPDVINNLNKPNISTQNRQSKTVKLWSYQNPLEDIDKTKKENLNKIRSLSAQNLVKVENQNSEESLPDSLETNCCSNKSKENGNILYDELYNDNEENNILQNNEDNLKKDEKKKEIEEEKKKRELMITNNIREVFIDSKISNKKEKKNYANNRLLNSSMTNSDYKLNFYKNGNELRQSYLAKLVSTRVWTPNIKPKQHNSLIIFDWDDTLLPTSFLTPGGIFEENMKLSQNEKEKILELEEAANKLLTEAVEKGNVYIITNAGNGWVEYTAKRFYPSILPILKRVKIVSARGEYEKIFQGNSRQWKIEAFLNLQKNLNMKLVTNIVCIGDSLFEMEAGRIFATKFTEAFTKTIKFREAPKLEELLKQLKLIYSQFSSIYSSIKNLTIRVERKKKDVK